MTVAILLVPLATFGVSALLTLAVRQAALRHGLLDVPNARSSHAAPTPKAGGVAIVLATVGALTTLHALGRVPWPLLETVVGGGTLIAATGLLDDAYALNPSLRLLVHAAAAVLALLLLGGLGPVRVGEQVFAIGSWGGLLLGVLVIVWSVNFFNFMDGIDGVAAFEAAFVCLAAAVLRGADALSGADAPSAAALAFAAACLGFLVWNWPPARIFMGDVGSGFLGYVIAVLAIAQGHSQPIAPWIWLTLTMSFFSDATVTLVRRLLRGERAHQAHRSHAYQWLARRWGSHARSTLAVVIVDVVWLLPCALFEQRHPSAAAWITLLAAAPVVAWVSWAGAGRSEHLPVT